MSRNTQRQPTISPRAFPSHFAAATLALAAALACLPATAAPGGAGAVGEAYAPGRILVMPRAGMPDAALARILNENGGGKARRVGKSELRIVDLPPGLEKQSVERLSRHPHIKFAEVDALVEMDAASNDPFAGSQWHLTKIGALTAWDKAQGDGVTIAILDTGLDASHPDLKPYLLSGWNFFNNTADTSDPYGHGSKVAGAAAAALNNGVGVASVAGKSKVMPIRIGDASGAASISGMAQGLTYAADRGVRVANISSSVAATSASVVSAAQYMKNKGGLVFVSAGNTGGQSSASPTNALIIVAATDSNDARPSWSTYGPAVSLSAPGAGIYTTVAGGGYGSVNGTSFAAPIAAGVAALVMAANPSLSSSQVESILFSTAVDLGTAGRDTYFGHGRVDAAKAVQAALSTSGTDAKDSQAPTASIAAPLASSTVSGLVAVTPSVADNVGVTKVELRVNGGSVATDTTAPFGFSWDSTKIANGTANLTVVAYDEAGNAGASAAVAVTVANNAPTTTVVADTTPPVVAIGNPVNGAKVSGNVSITVTASDNSGTTGLNQTLSINGKQVATASGGSLSYKWNTVKIAVGSYTLTASARDAAGNVTTRSVSVTR